MSAISRIFASYFPYIILGILLVGCGSPERKNAQKVFDLLNRELYDQALVIADELIKEKPNSYLYLIALGDARCMNLNQVAGKDALQPYVSAYFKNEKNQTALLRIQVMAILKDVEHPDLESIFRELFKKPGDFQWLSGYTASYNISAIDSTYYSNLWKKIKFGEEWSEPLYPEVQEDRFYVFEDSIAVYDSSGNSAGILREGFTERIISSPADDESGLILFCDKVNPKFDKKSGWILKSAKDLGDNDTHYFPKLKTSVVKCIPVEIPPRAAWNWANLGWVNDPRTKTSSWKHFSNVVDESIKETGKVDIIKNEFSEFEFAVVEFSIKTIVNHYVKKDEIILYSSDSYGNPIRLNSFLEKFISDKSQKRDILKNWVEGRLSKGMPVGILPIGSGKLEFDREHIKTVYEDDEFTLNFTDGYLVDWEIKKGEQ